MARPGSYVRTPEHRAKMREAQPFLGKKRPVFHTPESIEKIRNAKLGLKRPDMTGPKNRKWKGGISKDKNHKKEISRRWFQRHKEKVVFFNRRRKVAKKINGGSHTLGEWQNLKAQYNWKCPCCGRAEPEIKLTEDHIIPITKGGSDNIENIQPLCKSCNSTKNTKTIKYEHVNL